MQLLLFIYLFVSVLLVNGCRNISIGTMKDFNFKWQFKKVMLKNKSKLPSSLVFIFHNPKEFFLGIFGYLFFFTFIPITFSTLLYYFIIIFCELFQFGNFEINDNILSNKITFVFITALCLAGFVFFVIDYIRFCKKAVDFES